MPPIAVLSVVPEKEAHDCEPALEGAKRYLPIKVFSAHKSVQGVGAAQQALAACGDLHVALLHQKFTAPGKEEFSDTLRKFLKDKCPNTVVVGWGTAKSGGKQGEHFHHFIDCGKELDTQQLVATIKSIMSGAILPTYGASGRTSMDSKRPSMDMGKRPSMDMSGNRRTSMDGARGGSARRSMDGKPLGAELARGSSAYSEDSNTGLLSSRSLVRSSTRASESSNGMSAYNALGSSSRRLDGSSADPAQSHSFNMIGRTSVKAAPMPAAAASPAPSAFASLSMAGAGGAYPQSPGFAALSSAGMMAQPSAFATLGTAAQPSAFASLGAMPAQASPFASLGAAPASQPSAFSALGSATPSAALSGSLTGLAAPAPSPQLTGFGSLAPNSARSSFAQLDSSPLAPSLASLSLTPAAAAPAPQVSGELITMLSAELVRLRELVAAKRARQGGAALQQMSGIMA